MAAAMVSEAAFENYERVAAFLLNEFASHFDLKRVEGKRDVSGHKSGTTWEIDAKGVEADASG